MIYFQCKPPLFPLFFKEGSLLKKSNLFIQSLGVVPWSGKPCMAILYYFATALTKYILAFIRALVTEFSWSKNIISMGSKQSGGFMNFAAAPISLSSKKSPNNSQASMFMLNVKSVPFNLRKCKCQFSPQDPLSLPIHSHQWYTIHHDLHPAQTHR